jgi:hypothetical protein
MAITMIAGKHLVSFLNDHKYLNGRLTALMY